MTFWEDFDLLSRQLDSMDQFISDSYVHHIILNDIDKHLSELEHIVDQHKHHQYKIITVRQLKTKYPTLIDDSITQLGWHTQQVLKLVISQEIKTEFYCILDSKDFVISSFNPLEELIIDGKPIALPENRNIHEQFYFYRKFSYEVFGLSDTDEYWMKSHTPVLMKTSYVHDMIKYLLDHNKSLVRLIEGVSDQKSPYGGRCVEFYLYMAWLRLNNLLDEYCWEKDDFYRITFSEDGRRTQ